MDGIVYLEKLKDLLSMNMRELDAARMESIKRNEKKKEEDEIMPLSEVVEKNEEAEPEVKRKRKIKKKKVTETEEND